MEELSKSIFGLIYWVTIIILFIRGKVKLATFLSIFTISMYPLILGLITKYALPKNVIDGNVITWLPISFSIILFVLAVFSLFITTNVTAKLKFEKLKFGWFYFITGFVIYIIGTLLTLIFFFSSESLGYSTPEPSYGVITNIVSSTIASLLFYTSSKYVSINRPNLLRKLSSLIIFLFMVQSTFLISLILMYSLPIVPTTSFPFLAAINMACYMPFAIILILMRREHVTINSEAA